MGAPHPTIPKDFSFRGIPPDLFYFEVYIAFNVNDYYSNCRQIIHYSEVRNATIVK